MVDPFAKDPEPATSSGAQRAKADLDARFRHLHDDAADLSDREAQAGMSFGWNSSSDFKSQASQAASEAKGAAFSIAEQARSRLTEMVDQQKAAGAARISGVAQAAQSAAKDLDSTNPELARLVRSAAEGVERIAADVRSRDLGDVVSTLASFGRRQPVAFFGGAVLTGFLLSRFFKSDAPVMSDDAAGQV